MSDGEHDIIEATLTGNVEADSALDKTAKEVERVAESFEALGGLSADAATQATEQWQSLNTELAQANSAYREMKALYRDLMVMMLQTQSGNTIAGEDHMKVLARAATAVPIDSARHTVQRNRPQIAVSPDGQPEDVFAPEGFVRTPAATGERVGSLGAKSRNYPFYSVNQLKDEWRRADGMEEKMNFAASQYQARGPSSRETAQDFEQRIHEYKSAAAAAGYAKTVIETLISAKEPLEAFSKQVDVTAGLTRKMNAQMDNINELGEREAAFAGRGDKKEAGRIRNAKERSINDLWETMSEADRHARDTDPSTLDEAFLKTREKASSVFTFEHDEVLDRRQEEQDEKDKEKANKDGRKDYERLWGDLLRQRDQSEKLTAHIEGGIDKGERRTAEIADGANGKHFNFGGVKADIAEGVKRGLIDDQTASGYKDRIGKAEGLQGAASASGEAERFKKQIAEWLKMAEQAEEKASRREALGDNTGAKSARQEGARYSGRVLDSMSELKDILKQLKMEGLHKGAKDLYSDATESRNKAGGIHQDLLGKLGQDQDRPNTGGLGGRLRGEMHRLPGGRIISGLVGDQFAHAVNGGAGKMFESFVGSAAGQAVMKTTAGKAVMEGGKRMLGSAAEIAGGPAALTKLATNPATIAVAVAAVGAYMGNKLANKAYDAGDLARKEEMQAGDIARATGTTSRLLDDVRNADGNGGSGAVKNVYQQLGYSSGDVLDYMSKSNITGLSDRDRQRTTLTGLRIARTHGLDTGEMADLQAEMKRGMAPDPMNGGRLESDMNRFSLILSEAVKRGTGGPEMANAFKSALSSQTQMAGGKMFAAQNELFMSQILGLQRSNDPYLSGVNGVNTMTNMNNALGNVQGADRLYFYSALQGKSAKDLGYTGEQAASVDDMLKENPMLATGYMLKNPTKETSGLIRDKIYQYAQGDFTVAQGLFQSSGLNEVQASQAARDYSKQYKEYGGDISKIRVDAWDAYSGRNGNATKQDEENSFRDVQGKNHNETIARREDKNHEEIKLRASHVSFDSVPGQINIQTTQSVRLGAESARKGVQAWADEGPLSEPWRKGHQRDSTPGASDLRDSPFRKSDYDKTRNPDAAPDEVKDKIRKDAAEAAGAKGFATGGFTGGGGVNEVAGVVHGQEFVVNAQGTSQNRELLEYLNRGGKVAGFKGGGLAGNATSGTSDHQLISVLSDLNLTLKDLKGGTRADLASPMLGGPVAEASGGGFKGFFNKLLSGARSWFSGGGNAGGDSGAINESGNGGGGGVGGTYNAGSAGSGSFASGVGGKLANTALEAMTDSAFVNLAGRCSVFVRQVTERGLGMADRSLSGVLFGEEARESGLLWKKKGLTASYADAVKKGGLREGDTLFQMSGSGDHDGDGDDGHVGIVVKDPKTGKLRVAENSTRGRGGKMVTDLDKWGKIDLVGRLDGWGGPVANEAVPAASNGSRAASGSAVDRLIWGIGQQESGTSGGYAAVNDRTKAMGKYQIMPQNILGWGKNRGRKGVGWDYEALGRDITPAQFMADPKLQEQIAQFQIKKIYQQQLKATKGNTNLAMERAARVWYSNSPNASGGGQGNEPTTYAYGQQVLGRALNAPIGGQSATVKHGGTVQVNVTTNGKHDAPLTAQVNAAIVSKTSSKIAGAVQPTRVRARPGG